MHLIFTLLYTIMGMFSICFVLIDLNTVIVLKISKILIFLLIISQFRCLWICGIVILIRLIDGSLVRLIIDCFLVMRWIIIFIYHLKRLHNKIADWFTFEMKVPMIVAFVIKQWTMPFLYLFWPYAPIQLSCLALAFHEHRPLSGEGYNCIPLRWTQIIFSAQYANALYITIL